MATYVTTNVPEGKNWYFAGFLNQRFELGLTVGGTPEADTIYRRKLFLDRIQLTVFPKLTSDYAIAVDVPSWFKVVNLIVWRYTGVDYDSVELLVQEVKDDLERVEQKIDENANI